MYVQIIMILNETVFILNNKVTCDYTMYHENKWCNLTVMIALTRFDPESLFITNKLDRIHVPKEIL
jgi:hypothetical protein